MSRFQRAIPSLLFAISILLYLRFMSVSFEEWDSVQFALGVLDFDVSRHQPHPPGYPVYVFLSWAVFQITHDMIFSLTFVNAVSGAVAIVPFYFFCKGLFDTRAALVSTLLLMFNPAYWLSMEKTLSDGLATSFLIFSVYLLYSGLRVNNNAKIYASSILIGVSIGARQALFPFTAIWIVMLWKKRPALFRSGILFAATCLGWFLPMVYLTGFERYMEASIAQGAVLRGDSVFIPGITVIDVLNRFFIEYLVKDYAWISFGAVPHLEPTSLKALSALIFGLLALSAIRVVVELRNAWPVLREKAVLVSMLLFPYMIWMLVMMTPITDRYVLPTIPWICLTLGWALTRKTGKWRWLLPAILIAATFTHTFYYANVLHSTESAPTQLVSFVAERYNPNSTLILCTTEKRYFDYYHPEYRYLAVGHENTGEALELVRGFNGTVLVTDLAADRIQAVDPDFKESLIFVERFERYVLAHRRNWRVTLYEYQSQACCSCRCAVREYSPL